MAVAPGEDEQEAARERWKRPETAAQCLQSCLFVCCYALGAGRVLPVPLACIGQRFAVTRAVRVACQCSWGLLSPSGALDRFRVSGRIT
eukprot:3404227-Alexandrium_andersonii.AAC.1